MPQAGFEPTNLAYERLPIIYDVDREATGMGMETDL